MATTSLKSKQDRVSRENHERDVSVGAVIEEFVKYFDAIDPVAVDCVQGSARGSLVVNQLAISYYEHGQRKVDNILKGRKDKFDYSRSEMGDLADWLRTEIEHARAFREVIQDIAALSNRSTIEDNKVVYNGIVSHPELDKPYLDAYRANEDRYHKILFDSRRVPNGGGLNLAYHLDSGMRVRAHPHLEQMRDWIGVFGTSAQLDTFELRLWKPIQEYNARVSDYTFSGLAWPLPLELNLEALVSTFATAIRNEGPPKRGKEKAPVRKEMKAVRSRGRPPGGNGQKFMAWLDGNTIGFKCPRVEHKVLQLKHECVSAFWTWYTNGERSVVISKSLAHNVLKGFDFLHSCCKVHGEWMLTWKRKQKSSQMQ